MAINQIWDTNLSMSQFDECKSQSTPFITLKLCMWFYRGQSPTRHSLPASKRLQEKQIPGMKRAVRCCCCRELPAIRPNKRKLMSVRKQRESWEPNVTDLIATLYKENQEGTPSDKQTLRLLAAWQSQKTKFPSIPHGLNLNTLPVSHTCSKDTASRKTAKTKGSRLGQKNKQSVI